MHQVVVLVLVLILLCVVFCHKSGSGYQEHLDGNHIYTAGATMRVLGSQFTSTNQGENDVVYNDEINNWKDYNKSTERLVPGGPSKKPSLLKKNVKKRS